MVSITSASKLRSARWPRWLLAGIISSVAAARAAGGGALAISGQPRMAAASKTPAKAEPRRSLLTNLALAKIRRIAWPTSVSRGCSAF